MRKFAALSVVLLVLAVAVGAGCSPPESPGPPAGEAKASEAEGSGPARGLVTIYQSPTCSCCEIYKAYLQEQGFRVKSVYTEDIAAIGKHYMIPARLASCHIAVIEGRDFFVEGHVPVEVIDKALADRPDIDGIALPGMPAGSPGMPGTQTETFEVFALKAGQVVGSVMFAPG
jgi:hypothetical protein